MATKSRTAPTWYRCRNRLSEEETSPRFHGSSSGDLVQSSFLFTKKLLLTRFGLCKSTRQNFVFPQYSEGVRSIFYQIQSVLGEHLHWEVGPASAERALQGAAV